VAPTSIGIGAKTIGLALLQHIASGHVVTLSTVCEARHQTHSNQVRRITHPRQPCPTSQPTHSLAKVWFLSSISQAQCHPSPKERQNTSTINLDRVGGDGYICTPDLRRMSSGTLRAFNRVERPPPTQMSEASYGEGLVSNVPSRQHRL